MIQDKCVYELLKIELLKKNYYEKQVSASGKVVLITGCESPLAWHLARKLDEIGFTIFAGFSKRSSCEDADILKEEASGRMTILQLDVTSERQVCWN